MFTVKKIFPFFTSKCCFFCFCCILPSRRSNAAAGVNLEVTFIHLGLQTAIKFVEDLVCQRLIKDALLR